MPKKYSESIINELSESSFFKPPTLPQDNKTTDVKQPQIKPKNASKSSQPPKVKQSPTLPENETKNSPSESQEDIYLSNEVRNVRTNERFNKRAKIRHTFDIFQDQLMSLRKISIEREDKFGDRVLLGDLVQEALDMFITKERNKD